MNASITKLYAFMLLLYVLLVALTSNWTVFDAEDLEAKTANKRPLLEQQKIARGEIRSVDGELLAVSEPEGQGESKRFVRDYPQGSLFGNPVGYDFVDAGPDRDRALREQTSSSATRTSSRRSSSSSRARPRRART